MAYASLNYNSRWWSQLVSIAMCSVHWIESHFQIQNNSMIWSKNQACACVFVSVCSYFQSEKSAAPFQCDQSTKKRWFSRVEISMDELICDGIFGWLSWKLTIPNTHFLHIDPSYHPCLEGERNRFFFVFLHVLIIVWIESHSMISGLCRSSFVRIPKRKSSSDD